MNYKNRKIIDLAQSFGYTTAKDLANFLRKYKPFMETNERGKQFISLLLF